TMAAKGTFAPVSVADFGSNAQVIQWDRAYVSVGISDLSGVESALIALGSVKPAFDPGLTGDGTFITSDGAPLANTSGIHAPFAMTGPMDGFDYQLDLRVRGTASLQFAPVGRQSEVAFDSNWAHPNFAVGMLPSERTISADGFTASWRVPYL